MGIPLIIASLFGVITTLFHITGLALLSKEQKTNINENQRYLIIALSITELAFVASSVIQESIFYTTGTRTDDIGLCVFLYCLIVNRTAYYFIMFAITLDRFLELRLNIKYPLYWNKSRTKKTLILVYCILNVAWVVLLCIIFSYQQPGLMLNILRKIFQIYFTYLAPVVDTVFVIFATIVYSYIFFKLYKKRKAEQALIKQVRRNESDINIILRVKRYRVPFWIILTFILFWIVPNILRRISFSYPTLQEYFLSVSLGLYRTGPIADAVTYISNLNIVRVKLLEFKRNVNYNSAKSLPVKL